MKSDKNIKEYFDLGKFKIPNYQRGYKWGVPKDNECAVSILMDSLLVIKDNSSDYYIQGVTVCESDGYTILIDGQQRTTTFYLLLKYLEYHNLPEINYEIREDSDKFLKNSRINNDSLEYEGSEKIDEQSQDIYYFKKAIKTIHTKLKEVDKNKFKQLILEKVRLFYIKIKIEDSTKVFSMMNGQKAIMKDDELVKATLLSKSSRMIFEKEITRAEEWEINSLRNKYAREWDKWLYWWNKKSVREFYGSGNNPMGLLLEYFYYSKRADITKDYNYKHFDELFFKNNRDAKLTYKAIRDLQKTFEDWFNDYNFYNHLGLIFKSDVNKKDAILYLLENNSIDVIKTYSKWALVNATHRQITKKADELRAEEITKEEKSLEVFRNLNAKEVYGYNNNQALLQLLRRNVELDCTLKRKFDFSLFGEKSLEHIYPKSKAKDLLFDEKLNYSIHSIGNLVLLDRNTNSSFNDALPEEKTLKYFNLENVRWSLKLLHTVSVFTKKEWNVNAIIENQNQFLGEFKKYYNL
jgi:uncharacterized protein with ParB-like and HNH nuclease domain